MATRSKRKAGPQKQESIESNDLKLENLILQNEEDDSEDNSESEDSYFSGLEESDDPTVSDSDDEDDVEEAENKNSSDKDDEKDSDGNDDEDKEEEDKETEKASKQSKEETEGEDTKEKDEKDEYEYDSSDEEDIRNTVGNIPMQWYNDYPHIGYDLDGKQILQPARGDELDDFLNKMENPDYWKTVKDKMTGKNVVLTDEEIDIIERMEKGRYPDKNYDPYEPYVDTFTSETMIHPVTRRPTDKRSFIPSLLEKEKVSRLVHAIRMGWLKPSKKEGEKPEFYLLWENDDQAAISKRANMHIPAPKPKLPGHGESYNPPPEYLPTEEEALMWKEQDPEDRKVSVLPRKYDCLRRVPAYSQYIREQFERCLDLYLCPRQRKMRVQVNPEDLIPKLPKPMELQPFPTTQALVYKGHENLVRTISVDPSGQWLASGSDDNMVKLWEVVSGRCLQTIPVNGPVQCVAWCPNASLTLLAVAVENLVHIHNTCLGDKVLIAATDNVINSYEAPEEESAKKLVNWQALEGDQLDAGLRLTIQHPKPVKQVTWHGRGDYLATVQPLGGSAQVLIHQLSTRRTQNPFRKPKGLVQCVLFHPTRPFFFVATQKFVRVYNLLKQELTKKLLTNAKWVSSIAVHPGGDNLLVGSYDARLSWFDMDLSTKPYQTLRHHRKAVRQACYHRCYPLFASASDDGTVIVCHGMVYSDLLQNPLIVPVKILRGHEVWNDLGVLDCQFHPTQPWLFSSAADCTIRLFT